MSEEEVERLRAAFLAHAVECDPPDLPSSEDVWTALDPAAPAAERRRVIDQMATNPGLVLVWQLADQLRDDDARRHGASNPGGEDASPNRLAGSRRSASSRSKRWVWAPAALAAAMAAVLAGTWTSWSPSPSYRSSPQYRAPDDQVLELSTPTFPSDETGGIELRWSGAPQDTTYDVVVTTESLEPVTARYRIAETRLRVTGAQLSEVEPGSSLLWYVTAHLPDGQTRRSETKRLRYVPRSSSKE
ncbi:MAG: hypothetical protein ACFB9M_09965 [Myxococcota bacterium]